MSNLCGRNIVFIFLVVTTFGSCLFVTKEECPENEEYLLCGSTCPFNCSDPAGAVNCTDDCIEGCFCKAGYLRHDNGSCVNDDFCIGGLNSVCKDDEEFLSCGTACPATCAVPDPTSCGLACSVGCFCKSGFVRDTKNNVCVSVDKCPVEPCLNENEVYSICNATCEPSCLDPEPLCPQFCSGGCVCAFGFLRDENGLCISENKCPVTNSTAPGLIEKYINVINKMLHFSGEA